MSLGKIEVIAYAVALAFVFVRLQFWRKPFVWYLRYIGRRKMDFTRINAFWWKTYYPLDCMLCMSGWFGLSLALFSGHGFESFLILPLCMLIGTIIDNLMRKYL